MNNLHGKNWDAQEQLDSALETIRNQPVPPFPETHREWSPQPYGVEDGIEERESPNSAISNVPTITSKSRKSKGQLRFGVPLLGTCAAVLLLGAIVFWPGSKTVFAQVQEALEEINTVRYSVFDVHGDKATYLTRVTIQEPHLTRAESEHSGVSISNTKDGILLSLNDRNKTATFYEINQNVIDQQKQRNYLDSLKEIPENAIRRLEDTTFNGCPAEKYLAKRGEREFVVTIDAETKLPVEMKFTRGDFIEIITDFEFDVELDQELFSMKVPEGYRKVEKKIGTQHPLAQTLIVSPSDGLNHLGFESSIEDVIQFLGEPASRDDRKDVDPLGGEHQSTYLHYPNAGLRLFFNTSGLTSITCEAHSRVIDFAGAMDSGIKFGDSIEKVKEIYGDPEVVSESSLLYLRRGMSIATRNGNVCGLTLTGEVDPRIEINVSPDGKSWSQSVRPSKESDD